MHERRNYARVFRYGFPVLENVFTAELIIDFYKSMETAGFPFWRGYYLTEAMTMSEVAEFNQKRLEEKFGRSLTETRIND